MLKVKPLDDSVWREVLDRALPQHNRWLRPSDEQWGEFWTLLRSAPQSVRNEFATQNAERVRVRRRDGEWVLAAGVLLPGELVSADDTSPNKEILVDTEVHGSDEVLLNKLGVCQFPEGTVTVNDFDRRNGVGEWLSHWRSHYRNNVNPSATWSYLEPFGLTLPNGWHFLPKLTEGPNSKLTKRFLALLDHGQMPTSVKFGHSTVSSYPKIEVPHPLLWLLLRYGTWNFGGMSIHVPAIAERLHERALTLIPDWDDLQPAIEKLKAAIPKVKATPDQVRDMWQTLIQVLVTSEAMADDSLRELWTGAARDKVLPTSLPTVGGYVPLAEVFVTSSPDLARRARSQGHVAVTLDADALLLWLDKGARDLAELMQPEWREAIGPEGLLVATIPELANMLRPEVRETARCQPVAGLKLVVGSHASQAPCLMWKNTLLLDMAQLVQLARSDRLQRLLAEAAAAGWLKHDPGEALRILGDAKVDELRAHVAEAPMLTERLLRAVGNREEPLRQALGSVGAMDFIQGVEPLQLAELVLAQLGPATLSALKETLEKEGLKPPSRWNTAEARTFVASIGFPDEFAASPKSRREPEEFISGPIELPPLHDFQEEVLDGIQTLIASGTTRRRAVVSLPTGGGKTLVTVEAAVLYVLKPKGAQRSVIWVAQTDELCEQAVQAFRQVWLNLGAKGTDLRIVRLWGGNPNPAIQEPDKPVVMVASIQTLNSRMGAADLAGLRNPGLVVVDECHHAITASYTNLLRFLDAEAPRPGAPPKDEPPILGLSATPFRTDVEESERLARRFDSRWLPPDQEDLHSRLRGQGVLAEVDNEALESGIDLTPEEIERLSEIPEPWEGLDFENLLESINQRLAGSGQRNERLVNRIKEAEEGSILFFSNSVLHGQEMAARLNLEGVSAAAISGDTPSTARRYFLSRFQRGEITVL